MPPLQPVDAAQPNVSKPIFFRPSTLTAAGALLTLLVDAIQRGAPVFPKSWEPYLPQIATVLGIIAAWLKSREVDAKAGVTAATVADHLDPNTDTTTKATVETLRAVADASPGTGSGT